MLSCAADFCQKRLQISYCTSKWVNFTAFKILDKLSKNIIIYCSMKSINFHYWKLFELPEWQQSKWNISEYVSENKFKITFIFLLFLLNCMPRDKQMGCTGHGHGYSLYGDINIHNGEEV